MNIVYSDNATFKANVPCRTQLTQLFGRISIIGIDEVDVRCKIEEERLLLDIGG